MSIELTWEEEKGGTDWECEKKNEGYICDSRGTKGPSLAAASLYFPESQDEFKRDEGRRGKKRGAEREEEEMTHEDEK